MPQRERATSRSGCWAGQDRPRRGRHPRKRSSRHIVAESVGGGHLSRRERVMIENVLNLEEKSARRIMVPRPDIVYLSLGRPLDDNLRTIRQAGHTRYPLCEDDLTTVLGMIHVKDLFRSPAPGTTAGPTSARSPAKVPFLPETLQLDALLVRVPAQPGPPRHAARRVRQRGRHGHAWRTSWRNSSADPGRVRPRDPAGDRPRRPRLRGRRLVPARHPGRTLRGERPRDRGRDRRGIGARPARSARAVGRRGRGRRPSAHRSCSPTRRGSGGSGSSRSGSSRRKPRRRAEPGHCGGGPLPVC